MMSPRPPPLPPNLLPGGSQDDLPAVLPRQYNRLGLPPPPLPTSRSFINSLPPPPPPARLAPGGLSRGNYSGDAYGRGQYQHPLPRPAPLPPGHYRRISAEGGRRDDMVPLPPSWSGSYYAYPPASGPPPAPLYSTSRPSIHTESDYSATPRYSTAPEPLAPATHSRRNSSVSFNPSPTYTTASPTLKRSHDDSFPTEPLQPGLQQPSAGTLMSSYTAPSAVLPPAKRRREAETSSTPSPRENRFPPPPSPIRSSYPPSPVRSSYPSSPIRPSYQGAYPPLYSPSYPPPPIPSMKRRREDDNTEPNTIHPLNPEYSPHGLRKSSYSSHPPHPIHRRNISSTSSTHESPPPIKRARSELFGELVPGSYSSASSTYDNPGHSTLKRSRQNSFGESLSSTQPPLLPSIPESMSQVSAEEPVLDKSDRYRLTVRQQPMAARACGFGERDRRVIDPPPIVQLVVTDAETGMPDKAEMQYPFHVVHCTLWSVNGDSDETALIGMDKRLTRRLMGTLVASPFFGQDENGEEGCFFVFPDLSCRTHGHYRLRFVLMRLEPSELRAGGRSPTYTQVLSDIFTVYTAKEFPGMRPSTGLTKALKRQGCAISVKKGNDKAAGPSSAKRKEEDDDDGSEEEGMKEPAESKSKKRRKP